MLLREYVVLTPLTFVVAEQFPLRLLFWLEVTMQVEMPFALKSHLGSVESRYI